MKSSGSDINTAIQPVDKPGQNCGNTPRKLVDNSEKPVDGCG
jgi:hypothetical protein